MLEGRNWYRVEGASAQVLDVLRAAAPDELPESYVQLLSASNGGEGPLPVDPFNLCLDPAQEVTARFTNGNYGRRDLDGFLIFGGNGGGEYLAFDMRRGPPWPIVAIDMIAGPASVEVVAPEFDAFLELIGREPSTS